MVEKKNILKYGKHYFEEQMDKENEREENRGRKVSESGSADELQSQ